MMTTLPLNQFSRFQSRDLDETRQNVSEIFCPHLLGILSEPKELLTRVHEASLGDSALVYISYSTAVAIDTEELGNCFLVQVPWRGSAELRLAGQNLSLSPSVASIVSPDQAMRMRWSNDCSFFTVRLDKHRMEQTLVSLLGHELEAPLQFPPLFNLDTPAGKSWVNAVNFARQQLEIPLTNSLAQPLLKQFEQNLCWSLLHLVDHNYHSQLHLHLPAVTPKTIKQARDYIHDNLIQDINVAQLAKVTGVVPATLGKHFKCFLGQSPMEYVRNQKLEAVHKLLLDAYENDSITETATRFGFKHLGRFSDYYRRRYGELPSATIKRNGS